MSYNREFTPSKIEVLKPNEIFVFGSNESGTHGAGAARFAWDKLDAIPSMGFGATMHTFAIPTKNWDIQTLPLDVIQFYINRFIEYAKSFEETKYKFLVTEIGCGLAGYTSKEIGPMFKAAENINCIILPEKFVKSWE